MANAARSDLRTVDERTTGGAADMDGNVTFESLLAFTIADYPDGHPALSSVLVESGIEHETFTHPMLLDRLAGRTPDIIFIDVAPDTTQTVDTLFALARVAYSGIVQLVGDGTATIDSLNHTGQRLGLQMLPVLSHPLGEANVAEVLESEGLRASHAGRVQIDLDKALRNGWIEFWYQPKIDLRRKHLVGVEVLARARHPSRGVLSPWSFLSGADEKSLTLLCQEALISALSTTELIARIGAKLPLAVNVSLTALRTLPIAAIIRDYRPKIARWPGLLFDVTEKDIASDLAMVHDIMARLSHFGVKLAIDDYGRGGLSAAQLRQLAFMELKLDRSFVTGCSTDPTKGAICESVIHLVHSVGSIAVAIGVERAAEVHTLQRMGCDVGQGFLFGQPMPQDRFLGLLRERATKTNRPSFDMRR
jgi:EAL domain-containing protein (putative c-di-GMP-specific phosphodiesterase class I)